MKSELTWQLRRFVSGALKPGEALRGGRTGGIGRGQSRRGLVFAPGSVYQNGHELLVVFTLNHYIIFLDILLIHSSQTNGTIASPVVHRSTVAKATDENSRRQR